MATDKLVYTRHPFDFGGVTSEIYAGQCKGCGRVIEVSAQADYLTKICIRCTCGDLVGFVLLVN